MKRRKAFLFSIVLLVCGLTTAASGAHLSDRHNGQTPVKCKAVWLKQASYKEQRLSAVLLTNRLNAGAFAVERTLTHESRLAVSRGEYFLDIDSEKDYISYSTVPNYFKNPQPATQINLDNPLAGIKIDLIKNSLPKKE
jgi:hypothetical protein